jgi:hypothetical protein
MDWIKIYFSPHLPKIVLHFLYVLLCVLLTERVLERFGILYAYPEKIELPVVIAFILKGDILLPMTCFLLVYLLFDRINGGLNYLLFRATRAKIPFLRSLREKVNTIALGRQWFQLSDGHYSKMPNYKGFKDNLETAEEVTTNLMDMAVLFNSVLLIGWLCLLLYPQGGTLRCWLFWAGVAFYAMHVFNLLFLRTVQTDLDYYRGIAQQIDRQE